MKTLRRTEELAASLALAAMVILPLLEIPLRKLGTGIPGGISIVRHLMLWVAFLGAALAAREGRLLSLATGQLLPEGKLRSGGRLFAAAVAAAVSALFFRAGIALVLEERAAGTMITESLPIWVAQVVLPLSFLLIVVRLIWRAGESWKGRAIGAIGAAVGLAVAQCPGLLEARPVWPGLLMILAGTVLGGPIFAALGGIAALLFMAEGVPPVAVLIETYSLASDPVLAAIPLFTLVGFFLAEGRASSRLLGFFHAFFGWIRGGTAVVCALLCAFFTVFTGGSGVTILAMGGLLYQVLREDRYRDRFSLGLLTASGSLGLLLPPALPLILYGIVAGVSIGDLFIGGILPGIVLVTLVAAWGVREGIVGGVERTPFARREAGRALWEAKWELLLPLIVLFVYLGGFATLVEAAALAALYAFVTQCFVHRDVSLRGDLPRVFRECLVLIGGVLLILGMAMGFSSYMVDAMIPARALEWVQAHIDSRLVFLLCLNLFLLAVGAVMDIFSATVVVVPLIVPLGLAFGIDPIHLGIIFIANLELGYLTPPVGLNLFFASYRFERPLLEIYRAAVPFLIILGFGVLLITYVPPLTTGLLTILGRTG
ncbi:MAG: TRAP transporter large permease subunit [Gemmatimonadetes bacterium]|nr:TRAP transporter large permease subunit [Gemmatimonadota bacterium]